MTIYGYCRVSTHEQAEDGVSLAAQASQIKGYCQMRGWAAEPIIFEERGVSGSKPFYQRPEGKRLFEILTSGDAVVASKLDRMFRSAADALSALEYFKKVGVSVHLLDLGGDVTGNGIGKMTFTILAALAEFERERIGERIRDARSEMKRTGKYLGGKRRYGFDVVDGREVPRDEEQAVIREILDIHRDKGWGPARIATYMTQHGRACFRPIQVQRILEREISA